LSQKINFEVESGEIIDDPSQSEFATAKLRLFSSGANRHGMYCEEDVLQSTAITAYEKPVVFEITGNDFGGHSGKTIPAGFIVPNSGEFIRESDGRMSFNVLSKIWKRYSGKFLDIFASNSRTKSKLSVEMIMDETEDREDGLIGMKRFYYTAATILGDLLTEASPDANIEMLSFSYENAIAKEFGYNKYKDLDFQIPSEIKELAKNTMSEYTRVGKGGNSVSLSNARFFIREEKLNPERVRTIYKKLSSYSKGSLESEEEKIRFNLWGGEIGLNWVRELFNKLEEIDNKKSGSYFAENMAVEETPSIEKENGKEEKNVKEEEKEKEEMAVEPVVENKAEMAVETPEEEKVEDPKEEATETPEEEKKEQMSLDSYLDMVYTLALMEEETESRKEFLKEEDEFALKCAVDEIKKDGEKDFAVVSRGMFACLKEMSAKMSKMEESNKAYMAEFESLKSFKKSIEDAKFGFEVESTLKEVENSMPVEEIEKAREESAKFSLETIDGWKNAVKAKAFSFSKTADKKDKTPITPRWMYDVNTSQSKDNMWVKK
jgi:hypothetical protein